MYARMSTWWTVLRVSIEERLVYRGDFALGTLMRFLPIVTQIFLWGAIFAAIEQGAATSHVANASGGPARIAGYRYEDFVAYYLLTMVSRAFSSMPGLASGVARQIREGEIKKYLIQPVDMIGFLLLGRIAHKLVYYGVAFAPFALVFYLCRDFFPGWPAPQVLAAFAASLIMSFLLGFFMEVTMGLLGFWLLEVSSLLFVYMLFTFFLSGHMFPIDMLPSPVDTIVRIVPLQYLAYFPAAVFLGKIEGQDLIIGLAVQAAWVVGFILLSRYIFNRGVKRYSGFGG
jgi:ABC-2 type transport system permease protein